MPDPQVLDCLFIVPGCISGKASTFSAFEYTMPPLGILQIASWLRMHHYSVALVDFSKPGSQTENELDALKRKYTDIRWIGITVTTPASYNAYKIAGFCKDLFKEAKIVMGGAHVMGLKEEVMQECPHCDYAIWGEGEYAMKKLMDGVAAEHIEGLIYRKGNAVMCNEPAPNHVNLNEMPMPAFDLVDFSAYGTRFSTANKPDTKIGLMATRGCPYHCTFCAKITGSKLRFIPAQNVIEQLKYFKQTYNTKQISFYDDTFTINRAYVMQLCDMMIEEKLSITWTCFARVDSVDEALLLKMKAAGCVYVFFGVESLNEEMLLKIKKQITLPQIKEALELTHKTGIRSNISIILGLPGDTKEGILNTKRALLKLKTDYLLLFIFTPYPGTALYKTALAEGRIRTKDWSQYNLTQYNYMHDTLTQSDLIKLQKNIYFGFYFRWRFIYLTLKSLNSAAAFKTLFAGVKGFLLLLLAKGNKNN